MTCFTSSTLGQHATKRMGNFTINSRVSLLARVRPRQILSLFVQTSLRGSGPGGDITSWQPAMVLQSCLSFPTASQLTCESYTPTSLGARINESFSLEKRLPLKDDAFKTATQHFGPLKEHAEKLDSDRKVAEQLRKKTLAPYLFLKEQISTTNSQTTTDSSGCTIHYNEGDCGITIPSRKGTKRKANPSLPPPRARKSKKQQRHPANATVRSRSTSISTNPPTTPCRWEHVYHLEGSNKHLDSPETAQVAQVDGVAVPPQDVSFDHDPGSTTQLSAERILHVCGGSGGRNLPLAAVTGADDWGAVENAIIGPGRPHQDSRTAQYVTNQGWTEESGEMALPDRTEKTPKTGNSNEVQYDGKILCYRSRTILTALI